MLIAFAKSYWNVKNKYAMQISLKWIETFIIEDLGYSNFKMRIV